MLRVAVAGADVEEGRLVVEGEFGCGGEGREGKGEGEEGDGEGVDAEEEHAGVEAVCVGCGEDVLVGEVGGGKEEGPGDFGVHDYGVGVEPAVRSQSLD